MGAEEEGCRALRRQDAVRRPRRDLRQEQDGKREKGQHKSKASKAAGKKTAAAQKKKGVVKSIWAYIKKNKLNKGRTISPDAKLKKVLPANSVSMFKMAAMYSKHIK